MANIPALPPALDPQSQPPRYSAPLPFRTTRRVAFLAIGLWVSAARAHLGGTTDLLDTEKAALRITAQRIEHRALYDVHHLQREDGEIRQYSDPAGHIFAVAWKTRMPVRLADVLEAPATTVVAVTNAGADARPAAAEASLGRHSASSVSGDRVVHVLKLSHLFMGSAQLTTKIPAGVDVRQLQ